MAHESLCKVIDAEAITMTREDELQFEIARLRMKLERAYEDLKLAEERAHLQRLHIAQLQNQLGIGVCKEQPPFGVCREQKKHEPAPQKQMPAPKKARSKAGCPVSLGEILVDTDRMMKRQCQYELCENIASLHNGRYCSNGCAMKHRWQYAKQKGASHADNA